MNKKTKSRESQLSLNGRSINTTGNHPYLTKNGWVKVSELEENAVPKLNHNPSNSANFLVPNILTLDCCLNATSSDQIGELRVNANAKYGSSFVCLPCGEILFASDIKSLYSFSEIGSTLRKSKENKNANERSLILPYFIIFSLSDINSLKANFGEINSQFKFGSSSMTFLLAESCLKKENSMDASTINVLGNFSGIFYDQCFLEAFFLSSEPHFNANSSVILLFFNNSPATLNINLSESFSFNALETTELISFLLSSLNPSVNSSGKGIVIVPILAPLNTKKQDNYINVADVFFDRIVSIKQHAPQHVYDLEIEGNFIANEIITHNTFNAGIGTAPSAKLEVAGQIRASSFASQASTDLIINGSTGIIIGT